MRGPSGSEKAKVCYQCYVLAGTDSNNGVHQQPPLRRNGDIPLALSQSFIYFVCHVCRGQRTACRSQFSPSTLWVPGIQLGS